MLAVIHKNDSININKYNINFKAMKTKIKSLITLTVLFFLFNSLYSQFIIVGQHTTNDFYYDIPDTTITANPYQNNGFKYYNLDINSDGIFDFKFQVYHCGALGLFSYNSSIIALNNNKILQGNLDPCSHWGFNFRMAESLNLNDTIIESSNWSTTDNTFYFKYYYASMGDSIVCNNSNNISYIGARVIAQTDTLYCWIRISATYDAITLYEYAYNIKTSLINKNEIEISPQLYPNPNNGIFYIKLNNFNEINKVEITDIDGRSISLPTEVVFIEPDIAKFNFSAIKKGFYFIKITSINNIINSKLIIY